MKKNKREGRLRMRKIRGEGRRGMSTPQAPKLLDPLLFRRPLSYPLSLQLLNQQGGSQFKHLNPRSSLWFTTHFLLTKTLPNYHVVNLFHKTSLRSKTHYTLSLTLFIFLRIFIKHQNPTPNGFKGLITHVGTILGS